MKDARPVSEENAAVEEDVSKERSDLFDAINGRLIDSLTTEMINELVVVDFSSVFARNLPWNHHLLVEGEFQVRGAGFSFYIILVFMFSSILFSLRFDKIFGICRTKIEIRILLSSFCLCLCSLSSLSLFSSSHLVYNFCFN